MPLLSPLALRVAAVVAVAVGAVLGLLVGFGVGPWVLVVAGALVAGLATYLAVRARVARRLAQARDALRQARERRFENLDGLDAASEADEIDALLYQAYRAGRTLQQEIARLEGLENYRREFLGDVSHELRTPIFAVAGFAESLLDGALEDPRVSRRFVEKIAANARRLDALSRDLAEIAKLETGELQMRPGPFDLRSLARETVEALERAAGERKITLATTLSDRLPLVVGDRARVQQVLANLVENAVKYNEPGGHVEISTVRTPEGDVRVSVIDDGIGIPEEEVPRLTERFYRVDRSRSRAQGGTGLGLAIVKHILEAHGRRLEVESRVGVGSTFSFTLPAQAETTRLAA